MNKKLKKYKENEISFLSGGKISIALSDDDILNFVSEAMNTGSSNKKIYFGMISDELADKINDKLGINVKNYNLSLKADIVKKIFKDHGNDIKEKLRGQEAIIKNDFKYIDDIILECDNFYESGKTKQGKPSITFSKVIENKYILVEYISDNKKTLEVQTMWKHKKRTHLNVFNASRMPKLDTSETGISQSSFYDNNDTTNSNTSQ